MELHPGRGMDAWMVGKHVKRCLISLVNEEKK